jgi:multidrug efflux system outer membrane protein
VYSADAEIAALHEAIVSGQYSSQLRRVAIAALLGTGVDTLPAFTVQALRLVDTHVADNVSIDLLARRADINASRWQVEAAQQRLHVARAAFYPDVSVNALLGLSSIKFSKLLQAGSAVPSIGAAIHLPIFDSGQLRAQYGVRSAQVNVAIDAYNEAVVNAAREVATYAMQLQQLAAQRNERQLQRDAASHLLEMAVLRNQQGLSDARARLQASQLLQQQQLALTSLDAAIVTAQLNLILALGGGYQGDGYQSTDDHATNKQSSSSQSIHADAVATATTNQ